MTGLMAGTAAIENFHGAVLRPDEPAYDQARAVFNGMIDRRPAVILRCMTTDDVVAAVQYATGAGLPLTVYGGGHSVTGSAVADGAVCVDLRGLSGVAVDPSVRTVQAGGGLTWGELDAATQEHGLAVTAVGLRR